MLHSVGCAQVLTYAKLLAGVAFARRARPSDARRLPRPSASFSFRARPRATRGLPRVQKLEADEPPRRKNEFSVRPVAFPGKADRGVDTRRFQPISSIFGHPRAGRPFRVDARPPGRGSGVRSRPWAAKIFVSLQRAYLCSTRWAVEGGLVS